MKYLLKILILTVIMFSGGFFVFSQDNEPVDKSASSGGRVLAPAIEVEADVIGFVPNFSLLVDLGFYLAPEIILSPRIGFTYFMDIWDEVHDDMYLPAGFRLSLPLSTFLEVLYYFPFAFDFDRLRFRISAGGELFLYSGSSAAIGLSTGLGAGIYHFYDTNKVYFPISYKLGLRVYF